MKIFVISLGDKATGTANNGGFPSVFTREGNAEFSLGVSEEKDVIFFFHIRVYQPSPLH